MKINTAKQKMRRGELALGYSAKPGSPVAAACRNTGKIPGVDIGAPNTVVKRIEQGFRFIPMGNDAKFVTNGAAAGLKLAQQPAAKL
jgi:hypothetical protein